MTGKRLRYIVLLLLITGKVFGQESYFSVNADSISEQITALNKEIDITVSNVGLQEFLRAVANSSNLNLNIDPKVDVIVTNNFHGVTVKDMLIFIERNYPITIDVIGNIVDISRKEVIEIIETNFKGVRFDTVSNLISLDYYKSPLIQVAREITKVSKNNVILAPSIAQQEVNGYIDNMPFEGALEQFAFSNGLELRISESGYFILEPKQQETQIQNPQVRPARPSSRQNQSQSEPDDFILEVNKNRDGIVSVICSNAPLDQVIQKVSNELGKQYFISTVLKGEVSVVADIKDYEQFIQDVLNGTNYIYSNQKDIFIIGSNENSLLKHCEVFKFQNRTIDEIIEVLPSDVKDGLLINEFPDLNSLLISGGKQRVDKLTNFLNSIDKTVPVILIEIYIVNVSRNYTITTGINAGLGNEIVPSQGTVFPTIDLQIGSEGLNRIIEGFNGFGVLNLGKVTPGFYLTLKALEEQGILNVSSTPQLSTLNGYEATMKIGETKYYLEESSNFIGTQNPSLSTSKTYKDIKAELAVTIRPIVSGDDQITLNITVEQSDFTERISNEAPPGSVNRTFESIVRVKNQETIILGGLEEKRNQDSSTGTPWLSRIPIIKWLFSSRTKQNQNSKLSIFIKPTIIG
jgi:type IV pilus assembly protein PilQ